MLISVFLGSLYTIAPMTHVWHKIICKGSSWEKGKRLLLIFASVGDLSLLETLVVANHLFHIVASFSVSITLQGRKDLLITHSAQLTCSLKSMVIYEKLKEQPNMVTAVS